MPSIERTRRESRVGRTWTSHLGDEAVGRTKLAPERPPDGPCAEYWLSIQCSQEVPMQHQFRVIPRIRADRTPMWLRRLWAWL